MTKPVLSFFVFILLCHSIYVLLVNVCFYYVRFSFFSTNPKECVEEHLRNDIFCIKWNVKLNSILNSGVGHSDTRSYTAPLDSLLAQIVSDIFTPSMNCQMNCAAYWV